jgi:hypothetical protein
MRLRSACHADVKVNSDDAFVSDFYRTKEDALATAQAVRQQAENDAKADDHRDH